VHGTAQECAVSLSFHSARLNRSAFAHKIAEHSYFPLIACFRDEPGAEAVETMLVSAAKKDSPLHMTDVNYAGVKYSIVKKDGAEERGETAEVVGKCVASAMTSSDEANDPQNFHRFFAPVPWSSIHSSSTGSCCTGR
jgi:hypothetical protein